LKFNKHVPGQAFHGLHQITLNNCVQDPTYISEMLCRELFAAAGIPVPRATYAVLSINGHKQGLYVLTEAYNKQFLRRYFNDVSGNLYEGGVLRDVSERMDVNSGERADDQSELKSLLAAAREARENNDMDRLARVLDLDRFISMIAMEIILCHCDSYAMNRNNYRLYHNKDCNRMIFMPHGMDRTFGIGNRCPVNIPILPTTKGIFATTVFAVSEGREHYLRRVAELNSTLFRLPAVLARVHDLEGRVRTILENIEPWAVAAHHSEVLRYCEAILERKKFLDREIDFLARALPLDRAGCAPLTDWVKDPASPTEVRADESKTNLDNLLHLSGASVATQVAWRTKAILLPGRYEFTGRVRTTGITSEGERGAYLKVGMRHRSETVTGETDFRKVSVAFQIRKAAAEVEFGCELNAPQGEAWFDLGSLMLRRVE
jgi:hypothetical protein